MIAGDFPKKCWFLTAEICWFYYTVYTRQDIVRIDIKPKPFPAKIPEPVQPQAAAYLDNSHTIEINAHGVSIRISNDASPILVQTVLSMIGGAYAG